MDNPYCSCKLTRTRSKANLIELSAAILALCHTPPGLSKLPFHRLSAVLLLHLLLQDTACLLCSRCLSLPKTLPFCRAPTALPYPRHCPSLPKTLPYLAALLPRGIIR